ncbi:hypothetical protein Prudu_012096 [Prunus dulcis]|uniref:Single-stranded DNA binding protein Ssb-like OB fold domain-containing protein n=1 Tax=Prunus dulcis TaxID=3755 RepID=A0A4Y1RBV9_PRUDU|nr:hypothetical protein Prudu_012096 [Prunus dulcis]
MLKVLNLEAMSTVTNKTAPSQQPQQSNAKPGLRKPVFTKVELLKPETIGHTLVAKVLTSNPVLQKGRSVSQHLRQTRISECLIGDETGTILFTARNDQVDLLKPGTTVILRNARIDMFKGSMRLAVDKWGRIEVTEPANFVVKEDNNLSLVEYELVNVQEDGGAPPECCSMWQEQLVSFTERWKCKQIDLLVVEKISRLKAGQKI